MIKTKKSERQTIANSVKEPVRSLGGAHRQRDRQRKRDDLRNCDHLNVDGQRLPDDVINTAVTDVRGSQVAVEDIAHPLQVLNDEASVKAELLVEQTTILGRITGSQDDGRNVSRQQVD